MPTYLKPFDVDMPLQVPGFNVAADAIVETKKTKESKQINLIDFISNSFQNL